MTLGRHEVISADRARRQAAETIARIKSGVEPTQTVPGALTVSELAGRYLEKHVEVRCKPSTQKMYKSVVERFILPSYGHLAVEDGARQSKKASFDK